MSAPRSKRAEASVFSSRRRLVARTDEGRNHALSSATCVVVDVTSDAAPPITPAIAIGPLPIGDDEHRLVQLPLHAIERRQPFAGARAADADFRSGQARDVEGVHGMTRFDHHVVGDVHDVVDRTDAGREQAIGQPRRRRSHFDVGQADRVPAAPGVADRHRNRGVARPIRRRPAGGVRSTSNAVAASRASPITLRQSGRLAVISKSMTSPSIDATSNPQPARRAAIVDGSSATFANSRIQ